MPFATYYRVVSSAEPQVLTFCRRTWDRIEPYPKIAKLAPQYDAFDLHLWGGRLRALGYLAFLRHHGFPSPLMDWTRSPYIAAFFAFRHSPEPAEGKVSVYAYCERPTGMTSFSSGESRIFRMGPNVRTHRRHHLQQGEYTMCLKWEMGEPWRFVRHETVFERRTDERDLPQDLLWKIDIPWSERERVLRLLDDHNVNAFSLFDSDESLLETIAMRRLTVARPADV